jgi:hypothetical protein
MAVCHSAIAKSLRLLRLFFQLEMSSTLNYDEQCMYVRVFVAACLRTGLIATLPDGPIKNRYCVALFLLIF